MARWRAVLPACLVIASAAQAQDTLAVRDTVAAGTSRADSIRPVPPISPGHAFARSLLLPGWGQATMRRHLTAGLFVAFEGVAITMLWKSDWQLDYARVRGKYVNSHRQERQDWIVLLAFNHLFSAMEAWVAGNLFDFPAALDMRALPSGDVFYGVSVPLRR